MNEDKIREAIIRRLSNYIAQNDSDITEADLVAIANNKAYDEPYTEILLPSPHPEAREEDKAQGNNLLSELWKIVEGEAEWREMTLWTPFDPAKKVSGLTRGDLESIFNQYRVFSPVRDFLSRLAAQK